ncbi:MAG: ribose-phosphate diphosphokinase [Candidatus Nealsonbacteria bacterium]|nr:ribose-phosphate diphosphokinase [Candidatus Nealsonbacteria bacterium]
MKKYLILTSTVEHLAENLIKKGKDFELICPEKNKEGRRFFPDGEVYIKISGVSGFGGGEVTILHSGMPNPNDGLIELELILQVLKDWRIKPAVFFTYFPYGRQDKIFEAGETCAAENLIKKLVDYYKVKKIYIIDPHFGEMGWIKKYPIMNISAVSFLTQKIKEDFRKDLLLLTPDKGGKRRTGIAGLDKKRVNSFEVKSFSSKIAMAGKNIAVVDDIIGTGGTLAKFYEFAKQSDAKEITALITHGVLDQGIQRIKSTFAKLYFTNTINKKEANIDITDLIVSALE